MVSIVSLWLPILVSAIVIFFASFLAWMVLPHHKADWKKVPDEDAFMAAIGQTPPGQYMYPFCSGSAEMKDEAFKKRWASGPHGTLNVWLGAPVMGKNLVLTFIFYLVVGVFVGYLASLTRPTDFMSAFRAAGAAAVTAYVLGQIPNAIWFGKSPRAVMMDVIDGVVYGVLTGLIFGWMWPAPEAPMGFVQ